MTMLRSGVFGGELERYVTTHSAQTAFALAAGRNAVADIDDEAGYRVVYLGPYKGGVFTFFGTGADDSTFDYRLYLVRNVVTAGRAVEHQRLTLLGGGTATLSTVVGSGSEKIASTDRIADTLTWTIAAPGTALVTAFNAAALVPTVYSPGSNTAGGAQLVVPDFFDAAGFLLEFDLTGATGANALYGLIRGGQ